VIFLSRSLLSPQHAGAKKVAPGLAGASKAV
jgi:hypothetical protein